MNVKRARKPIEVLLIEGNHGDLILTKRMLEKSGDTSFRVSCADSLAIGIKRVSDGRIDVIILNPNLPGSAGVETFVKLTTKVPEIPIVVLSGLMDEEESRKAIREGAQDYLIKGQTDGNLLARSLRYAIERKKNEHSIKQLAYHDPLTGLPNRILLNDRYEMGAAKSKRYHKKAAVIILDLDNFKEVNDNFGHDTGDDVLREFGGRLTSILRQTDTVCRIGGDEFALLIPELTSKEAAKEAAQRILEVVRRPFALKDFTGTITASLGIAIHPEDGENLETLIKHADTAMYEVKKMGRNNYLCYQPSVNRDE